MEETPPIFALFIGINTYHPEAALAPLHGAVADARALRRSVAARYGVAVENLALLQDDEATCAAILQHVDTQFVARAARWARKHKAGAPAPHFLIYFAGYGAQLLDTHTAVPRMVDTIVAYDSRVSGGRDLCPADFVERMAALRAHGCAATMILDCGHMATASGARACAPDMRQGRGSDSGFGSESGAWRECGTSLLTAAHWGEAVREQALLDAEDFTTRGSFTFALQQILLALPSGAPPAWADFAARVIDRTHALAPGQTPCQTLGPTPAPTPGTAAGDALLFGGARLAPAPPISVMRDDEGQLWLDAGRAHGLLNGSRAIVVPVHAPAAPPALDDDAPPVDDDSVADDAAEDSLPAREREIGPPTLAVVEVARAGLEYSLCTLVEGALPALPAPAAVVQAGRSRMRVRYAGVAEPQIASDERGALAARINAVAQRVDKAEDVAVVHADGAFWLCDAAGERISHAFAPEAVDDMRAELAHRARYAAALAQRGSSAELPSESVSLTLERLVFDEGGFAHSAPLESSAGELHVAGGMPLVVHVTNHSARPLEIALFRFGPLCDIACVWPLPGARTEPLAPGATRTIGCSAHLDQQVHTPLPEDAVEARLIFRVYGAAEAMAAALLEQGPLGSVLEVTQAGMSSAPLPPPDPWVSAECGLRLLPPAGALHLVGGQTAQTRALPRVETPPGFLGSLQWLGPTARAEQAEAAWPAALAAHPMHFRPHATVGATAGQAIAGFELVCGAQSRRLVSAATPMQVHIAPPAGAALLAFAWDGVNAYPVGRCPVGGHALEVTWLPSLDEASGDGHDGGKTDGDGATGAAQAARALRIFLCEVRGAPAVDVGLFAVRFVPGAWAASASRAAFVRAVPGGTLRYTAATRARPHERIAIIVHGFADNSTEEAEWLIGIQARPNGPIYDRILCFEWESLHTDVRANGERLRDAVAALAMNEAPGATIDLFAHSMGALVARVYVELLGGDAFVQRCFFTGPPNLGTPLASTALFTPWLLMLLLNLPAPTAPALLIAWALGTVAWQMQGPGAMHPNAPLLEELNNTRNGARLHYHVIAGNAQSAPAARAAQWRRVLAAGLDAAADWFYEGDNDWVVGMRSCMTVPMVNHPGGLLLTAEVDATHIGYYRSDAVTAQMLRWLAPAPQSPPPAAYADALDIDVAPATQGAEAAEADAQGE